jgi:putative chitinase
MTIDLSKAIPKLWNKTAPKELQDKIIAQAPTVLAKYEITTPKRLAHFFTQVSHESGGGKVLKENTNYSIKNCLAIWPNRFKNAEQVYDKIGSYQGDPDFRIKLLDYVYGSRMGNLPGTHDGSTYIGRGLIQITGRDGYVNVGKIVKLELEKNPEIACSYDFALEIACGFWTWKSLNKIADRDNIMAVTKAVNGGLIGIKDRQAWLAKWKAEFE